MRIPANGRGRTAASLFYKLRFTDKILLIAAALLLGLSLAGALVFRSALQGRLEEAVVADHRALISLGAQRVVERLSGNDESGLSRTLTELCHLDDGLAYAVVRDRQGELLAHSFSWDPPAVVLNAFEDPEPLEQRGYERISFSGQDYLALTEPLLLGAQGAGELQLGIHAERADLTVRQLNLIFLTVLLSLTAIGLLAARHFAGHVARPVNELIFLADEVSVGNLDVDFDFGVGVRCWEIKDCGQTACAAYQNTSVQCWYVDGTPCEGYEPRFPEKLVGCRSCEVYRAHKGDEIVQLADSFRHMTQVLKSSRRELERSNRFQHSLIRDSLGGIIATDERDVVRVFNGVAQRLTGFSEGEVVGRLRWDALFPGELDTSHRRGAPERDGQSIFGFYRRETRIVTKAGGSAEVLASAITLREDGSAVGKVFFFRDLREIKQLRRDLVRSERLAAIGETVASISHAIKNILDGLRGGAYIYNRGLRLCEPAVSEEGWSMVERNIDLISALVADLLNYARERKPDLRREDPNDLLRDVAQLLSGKAAALGVELVLEADPQAAPARYDSHGMHQCLTNLVTNAIDAVGGSEGGKVILAASPVAGDELELRVTDNGPGLADEVQEQLFSGMTSTKGSKGTGLGLLVAHKIVAEHQGAIEAKPVPQGGVVFRVRIPRHSKQCKDIGSIA